MLLSVRGNKSKGADIGCGYTGSISKVRGITGYNFLNIVKIVGTSRVLSRDRFFLQQ
jgi:hypothetical protein